MTGTADRSPRDLLDAWLRRQGRSAEFRETHASVVAITEQRVYKMKKPVRFPFLDLSTPERRERVCRRELQLNRRLAPDVYLGIVAISDDAGRTVDHAVEMVRLPDQRRLDDLLETDDARDCVLALARRMAEFHASAEQTPQIAAAADAGAVRALWRDELDGLRQFAGPLVDASEAAAAEHLAERYVAGRGPAFDLRVQQGRARDGHGDLRADDVFCMPDGLRVIDCLEFDDRLRWGDVLADVAFLAMDLEWLGRPDLARAFLAEYREAAHDDWPESLEHHWIAYRAHVRAKVACLRWQTGDPSAQGHARGHLALALRHLRAARVRVVLVGGLPGTGKSTLARALADEYGWSLLRSDVLRRELFPTTGADAGEQGFGEGRYTRDSTAQVYRLMLEQAAELTALGRSVILDASWTSQQRRDEASALAEAGHCDLVALECRAPAGVAADRIAARAAAGQDESEADAQVARSMAAVADPWPEATGIDTSDGIAATLQAARTALAP